MCRTFWHYQKSITTAHTAQELVIRFLRHFLFMTIECSQSVHSIVHFKIGCSSPVPCTKLITVHTRHSQNASSTLSAASQLIFAHKVALPPYLFASRFSCEHEICLQKVRVNCKQNCKLILNFLFFSCFCSCTRAIIDHKISKFRYKSTMVFDEFQLSCLFSDISSFLCMFRLSFAQQAFLFLLHWYSHILFSERRYFHGTSGYE